MIMYLLIFLPMLMGFVCYGVGKRSKPWRSRIAALTGAAELALAIAAALQSGFTTQLPKICGLGLSLELDGFRKVYVLVIAFMWLSTLMLSDEYFAHYHNRGRYYFFNLLTLGATMGVFLAKDLFTALIFFEIMSFTSYTWVIHEQTPGAIRAANTYLAVAVIGGLAALMGLFLLQSRLGTTDISQLYALSQTCTSKTELYVAGGCILFGFGAKAGMFPVHIWLPKAHPVAPAPASALLSGVLTKSGIWGILAISCNIFRYDSKWGMMLLLLGTLTMVLGAVLALMSIDLKRTLACSSMSQIGFILIGIGMMGLLGEENALAARGALLHMVNHSMFKLVLFLCAGVVYMNLHALDLNEIRGFGRKKPLLHFAFLMGALGIGGVPLLNGYVSKTLLHESIVEGIAAGYPLRVIEWLFLISGGLTLAYMTKLYVCLFIEKNPAKQAAYDDKKNYMNPVSAIALCVPALLLPILGLTANHSMNYIAQLGTDFFHAGALEHHVKYLSLENLKGALISIVIGALLYFIVVRKLLRKKGNYVNRWPAWLDLEDLLYRPLLLKWLPGFFGAISTLFGENRITGPFVSKFLLRSTETICTFFAENRITAPLCRLFMRICGILSRAISDLLDAVILLLRKTVYRESPLQLEDKLTQTFAYRVGNKADTVAVRHGKEKPEEHRYARLSYRLRKTFIDTTHRLTGNLSFALLMLCAAACAVFVYILLLH